MPIGLIACDLDGTLVGPDLNLTSRLRYAIRRALERGIVVTLATGRGFASARSFARQLDISAPLICYQGALLRSQEGEVFYQATLPKHHLPPVIAFCKQGGWELSLYYDDQIYYYARHHDQAYYDRWFDLPSHFAEDLMAALPGDPLKFLAVASTKEQGDLLEREMRALAGEQFQIVRSHPWFVEGLARGVSKGDALARLAAHLGVPRERVMAIGDNGNDRAMVEWAAVGVAMGNASPDVKAVADVLAPPYDQDGAAWAIEKYALEEG